MKKYRNIVENPPPGIIPICTPLQLEVGDRVIFDIDMSVGHEGIIPKGATGTYRGRSPCVENYQLFQMDEDYGFLQKAYDFPNCFLGDDFCLDEDHGEIKLLR